MRKPLLTSPKRLQRIMLCIEKYDLDVAYVHERELTDTRNSVHKNYDQNPVHAILIPFQRF